MIVCDLFLWTEHAGCRYHLGADVFKNIPINDLRPQPCQKRPSAPIAASTATSRGATKRHGRAEIPVSWDRIGRLKKSCTPIICVRFRSNRWVLKIQDQNESSNRSGRCQVKECVCAHSRDRLGHHRVLLPFFAADGRVGEPPRWLQVAAYMSTISTHLNWENGQGSAAGCSARSSGM